MVEKNPYFSPPFGMTDYNQAGTRGITNPLGATLARSAATLASAFGAFFLLFCFSSGPKKSYSAKGP